MPSSKSARVSDRRQALNQPLKTKAKSYIKKAKHLLENGSSNEASHFVDQAVSALDKAALRGVIHPNNAARRKSRLVLKYNESKKAADEGVPDKEQS
jgi:small subunit ribosomal protein S20